MAKTEAKTRGKAKRKPKKENAIVRYIRDTRAELRKVNWPSRRETIRLTQIVLIVTMVMGLFLWLVDLLFSWWLEGIVVGDVFRITLAIIAFIGITVTTILLSRQRV